MAKSLDEAWNERFQIWNSATHGNSKRQKWAQSATKPGSSNRTTEAPRQHEKGGKQLHCHLTTLPPPSRSSRWTPIP